MTSFAEGGAPKPDARGPVGHISMIALDDQFFATAKFVEDGVIGSSKAPYGCSTSTYVASPEPAPELSAGLIMIDLPTRDGTVPVELAFDPLKRRYEGAFVDGRAEPGAVLRLSAEGDAVPAFEVDTRAAPNVVFDAPEVVTIDANAPQDISFGWTAEGDGEDVFVDLTIDGRSVSCFFAPNERRGTIPASMIATLAASGASCELGTCTFYLASRRSKAVANGAWTLVLFTGSATFRKVNVTQ